ncbi:MAG: N-acetyltransferase GCN5 [bacterium]|nr:MAG: N-acetyltransferase GCN5 [bacterium]
MTDAIEAHMTAAREASMEGRAGDARNSWARAAALSRESGAPLLQARALRHLSDLDREADHLEQALAHAEQAAALYQANGQAAGTDLANALRLKALALDGLRRGGPAQAAWKVARALYADAEVEAGVAECDARLAADAGG